MVMHQKEIEEFAFLFLCGKHDRDILQGKEKMTFSDFERLRYITEFLGMNGYNLEIWNRYAGMFKEQFQKLNRLYEDTCSIVDWDLAEVEEEQYDRWICEFCERVPEQRSRKKLKEIVRQEYERRNW